MDHPNAFNWHATSPCHTVLREKIACSRKKLPPVTSRQIWGTRQALNADSNRPKTHMLPCRLIGQLALAVALAISTTLTVLAQFSEGTLILSVVGDGVAPLNSAAHRISLVEFFQTGITTGRLVTLPDENPDARTDSGSAKSSGHIRPSRDGHAILVPAFNAAKGTSKITSTNASSVPRTVSRIQRDGTIAQVVQTQTQFSEEGIRSITESQSETLFLAAPSGLFKTNPASSPVTFEKFSKITEPRLVASFSDASQKSYLFVSTSADIHHLGTLEEPTEKHQSLDLNLQDAHAFVFLDRTPSVGAENLGGLDTLYVADSSSTSDFGRAVLKKFEWQERQWKPAGVATLPLDGSKLFGLTATQTPSGAVMLHATTSISPNNALVTITDHSNDNRFGGRLTGTLTVLTRAGENRAFRGIASLPESLTLPDLTVSLPPQQPVPVKSPFPLRINILNRGAASSAPCTLRIHLPPTLTRIPDTSSNRLFIEESDTLITEVESLPPNSTTQVNVLVEIPSEGSTTIPQGAIEIDSTQNVQESVETNNENSPLRLIAGVPRLTIAARQSNLFQRGDADAQILVKLKNEGIAPTLGSVELTPSLPLGIRILSFSGSGWSSATDSNNSPIRAIRNTPIPPETETDELTIHVAVDSTAENGIATLSTTFDGNPISDESPTLSVPLKVQAPSNGVADFASETFTFQESSGTVQLNLVRQGGRRGPLTVSAVAESGTATINRDFLLPTTSITFPDGSDSAQLPLQILQNPAAKSHRTFAITLRSSDQNNPSRTARITILKPDSTPPTIKVSAPTSGSIVKGPNVDVSGKVSDNFNGISMRWSVNDGPLLPSVSLPAIGLFRIPVATRPGINRLRLSATDAAGNETTVQHTFLQTGTTKIALETVPPTGGSMALSPKLDPSKIQIDAPLTLIASPSTGYLWSGWETSSRPGELLRTPRITLQSSPGLVVRAIFSLSPYTDAIGSYAGIVRPPASTLPRHENSGISTVTLTASGTFSGKLRIGNEETSLSGWLDETGTGRFGDSAQDTLPWYRKDGRTLHLRINVNPLSPAEIIGSISDPARPEESPLAELRLLRAAVFASNPNPGTYNVAAPSKKQSNGISTAFFPEGAAIGTVVVPITGPPSFAIKLPDGTSVSGSSPLRENGSFALYTPLYNGLGQLSGDVFLETSSSKPSVSGENLLWLMPAGLNPAYPLGWPEGVRLDLQGTLYPATAPTLSNLLPDLNDAPPHARLSFSSEVATTNLRADISISSNGTINATHPSQSVKASINLKTGFIQGILAAGKSTTIPFSLALVPKKKGSDAFGQFILPNGHSGKVTLSLLGGNQGRIILSEIASKNVNGPYDEDGDASDWIELHNPNTFKVDLDGWSLSDDPNDPRKWTFPKTEIGPQGFLLVWASGKNRRKSDSTLHTNFSLKSDGEFLSLMRADGSVEQSFPQGIPKLASGESYGVDFGSVQFVEAGTTVKYFTGPGALPTNWTSPDFADASWKSGRQPLGFGVGSKGLSVRQVLTNYDKGGVPTLAQAEALLSLPRGHSDIVAERTFIVPQLNLLGDGGDGHYDGNLPVPLSGEPYVIRATGTLLIPESGVYTFGLNSDDGGSIRIDGIPVMIDDSNHGPEDHLSGGVSLSAGPHAIEVIMWEQGGGDEVELFAARGTHDAWNENFRLVGAADGLPVITLGTGGDDSPAIGTNIQASVKATRTDFGARYAFTCADPTTIERLTLTLAANDGVIVHLNGTEVLRTNAGLAGSLVSRATTALDPIHALAPKVWDLSRFKPLLRKGQNILAARCLSSQLNDESMFLSATLSGHAAAGSTYGVFSPSDSGLTSTPNAINSGAFTTGTLGEVRSSHSRGIYTAAFQLTLVAPTPGATVRYTLDGSTPSITNGEPYTKPLTISKTTVLRFAAVQTGFKSGPVSTATFLFPNDIIRQSANGSAPAGWPTGRINGQAMDFGMDPRVVNSGDPEVGGADSVKAALEAIPSLSIVTELGNLFDPVRGIWVNPYNRGLAWERTASVEFINDATHPARGFQTDCGIRIRGGFSRSTDNPKHALKLYFRDDYSGPLKYPIFGASGASSFEQIDVRTAQNYSWSFGGDSNNTFLREEISRELQGAMGHPYARGRDFHLFLNGQYWGLYNFDERTEASFGSAYLGGKKSDYDAIKGEQDAGYTTGVNDGNLAAWTNFFELTKSFRENPTNEAYFALQGLSPDGAQRTESPAYLDADNLIDYMLLTFWSGNLDGCTSAFLGETAANNWSAIRRRNGTRGFVYFAHDFEHSFFDVNQDRTGPFETENKDNLSYSNPMFIHHNLRANAEYRMRWADRIQQHCFGDGVLTANSLHQRISARAAIIDRVIVAESARWGDAQTGEPLTRREWRGARDQLLNEYLPNRGDIVIRQLREDGLYPTISAPVSEPAGGAISFGSPVRVSTSKGVVYYTWNEADPREVGGAINPSANTLSGTSPTTDLLDLESTWRFLPVSADLGADWTSLDFDDSAWSTGHGEMGFGDGDETTTVPTISNPTPELSRNVTTYFRTTFSLPETSLKPSLTARIKFDDGIAIYLNGHEVFRSENLAKTAGFADVTSAPVDDETAVTTINIPSEFLTSGRNILAAEVHQSSPDSSDISFRCELSARAATDALIQVPDGKNILKMRALHNGEWSALVTHQFVTSNSPTLSVNASVSGLEAGTSGQLSLTIQNDSPGSAKGPIRLECDMPSGFQLTSAAGAGWQILSISPSRLTATLLQIISARSVSAPLTLSGTVATSAEPSLVLKPFLEFEGARFEPAIPSAPISVTRTGPTSTSLETDVVTVPSDATTATVAVVRTGDISKSSSVTISTSDGTATKERDFLPLIQSVSFAPGEFKKQVSIQLLPPSTGERAESFKVTLSKPEASVIGTPSTTTCFIAGEDTQPPSLQLVTKDFPPLTVPSLLLSGNAADDQAVTSIEMSINGSPWQKCATPQPQAAKRTTFTTVIEPPLGVSTVALRAIDLTGNPSTPAFLNINRLPSVPVSVTCSPAEGGSVAIKPAELGNWLPQNVPAEFRAVPSSGWFFSHWNLDSPAKETPSNPLTFTPVEPTRLVAVFKPSPYDSKRSGTFIGTIQTVDGNAASASSEGLLKINVTGTGAFSGTATLGNSTLPFAGKLGLSGDSTTDASPEINIPRRGDAPLRLRVKMDLDASPASMTAFIENVERTFLRPIACSSLKRTVTTSVAQNFALKLKPRVSADTARFILPDSALKLTLTKTANGLIAGKLPDGSAVTGSFPVCEDGSSPLFMTYGVNKQHLLRSEASLTAPSSEPGVLWIRNADPNYPSPEGWPSGIKMYWERER